MLSTPEVREPAEELPPSLTRYNLKCEENSSGDLTDAYLEESPDGEYVKLADVAAASRRTGEDGQRNGAAEICAELARKAETHKKLLRTAVAHKECDAVIYALREAERRIRTATPPSPPSISVVAKQAAEKIAAQINRPFEVDIFTSIIERAMKGE